MTLAIEGPAFDDAEAAKAVDKLRKALSQVDPYTLWQRHELIDRATGRRYAVPLLALTRQGLWLIDVDPRAGTLSGDETLWHHKPTEGRERSSESPLVALNRTADELRAALDRAATHGQLDRKVPVHLGVLFVRGVTLSGALDGRSDLFQLEASENGRQPDLLATLKSDAATPAELVRRQDAPKIRDVLRAALTPADKQLVAGYHLAELLEDHELWQEHRARHATEPGRTARVRTWLLPRATSETQRKALLAAVRAESRALAQVGAHPHILALLDTDERHEPPRLVFEDFDGLSLDQLLRTHPDLPFERRIEIVLAVGDALAHCHRHELTHRNLSPASVLARVHHDHVDVRLHRFEGALSGAAEATRLGSRVLSAVSARIDELYRAPEVLRSAHENDPSADLFSLGALTWFLLTGAHPAPTLPQRAVLLEEDEGLRLWRKIDNVEHALDELVAQATRAWPHERTLAGAPLTVPRFLADLRALTRPPISVQALSDPLTAGLGTVLKTNLGDLEVRGVLGTGATARVLAVAWEGGIAALKLPLSPHLERHLAAEADAIDRLGSPGHDNVVSLLDRPVVHGPDGDLHALLLQFAGDQSLADRVRAEGSLSLDFCARLGDQLLAALVHLHEHGVQHRDLKPANLAFASTANQAHKLTLFDFSLAAVAPDQITAGTAGWRDPYLPSAHRGAWDDAADLYGAAACLYYALTGERPALANRGEHAGKVRVEPTRFDPTLRGALTTFFTRAFAPDLTDRYPDADAMHQAWRTLVHNDTTSLHLRRDAPGPDPSALRAAHLDTPVGRLGLTARAVDGLERAGVFDVRDLLALPRNRLSAVRGIGADTAQQVQLAVRELHNRLGTRDDLAVQPFFGPLAGLPRLLADANLPLTPDHHTLLRDAGLRTTHDLALHGHAAVVRLLNLDPAATRALHTALRATAADATLTGQLPTWVRTLLSPNSPSHRTRWEERVRMLTGLDPMPGESSLGARTTAQAAEALGDPPATFRSAFHNIRQHWRKHRAEADAARDAVLAALAGPAAPLHDVATHLLEAHAPEPERASDDALRQAAALVRFATELDVPDPPLRWRLLSGVPWVAVDEATLTAIDQAAATLTALVADGTPATATRAAEAIAPHLADTPLASLPPAACLELVARAAPALALSSRQEPYPRDLPAPQAIALAAPVLQGDLSPAEVRKRVRGRFPVGAALPDRPELDALLAPLGLAWSEDRGRYLRPGSAQASLTVPGGTRLTTSLTATPVPLAADRFHRDLQRALESGSFRVLRVGARDAERAAARLCQAFPELQTTNLDDAVWQGLHERVAATPGAQLDPILNLEHTRAPAEHYDALLTHFLTPVLDTILDRLLLQRQHRPQLLLYPGLLARYEAREPLDRLIRTATDHPTGALWLLLPAYDDARAPTIQHPDHDLPIPLVRPAQSLRVPRRWLHTPTAASPA